MDNKETLNIDTSNSILLTDSAYYKHIYKKTEKIVCAVFYILEHADKGQSVAVITATERTAQQTLDAVLKTLTSRLYTATELLYALLHSLLALESQLRVAQASRLIAADAADLLSFEIQNVMRSLRQYLSRDSENVPDLSLLPDDRVVFASQSATFGRRSEGMRQTTRATSANKRHNAPQHTERQQTIKDILASKGQSTIKDIAENIPDFSEKTVQRELNTMIQAGIVRKEGERRWSRYSLAEMS